MPCILHFYGLEDLKFTTQISKNILYQTIFLTIFQETGFQPRKTQPFFQKESVFLFLALKNTFFFFNKE
jgi:hypothetical protein